MGSGDKELHVPIKNYQLRRSRGSRRVEFRYEITCSLRRRSARAEEGRQRLREDARRVVVPGIWWPKVNDWQRISMVGWLVILCI